MSNYFFDLHDYSWKIIKTTKSSDTNLPAYITRFNSAPIFDPFAISEHNISPVDGWQMQNFSFNNKVTAN